MIERPMNLEAEEATLGAILLNRDAILVVRSWLEAGHFWLPKHGAIYTAMCSLLDGGVPPDVRTVADALGRAGMLAEVGGVVYLSQLVDATPSSYHIEHYAREVHRCAVLRDVIAAGERIVNLVQPGADADQVVADAIGVAGALLRERPNEAVEHIAVTSAHEIEAMERPGGPCVSTGLTDLDGILGGFFPTDFLLIGARPAMGKTALMLTMVRALAEGGTAALVFSLEMSRGQLVQRLAAAECGLDVQLLRRRLIPRERLADFAEAMRRLSALPIFTCDYTGLTPASLRAHVMRHLHDYPQTVVFVDYLQLMEDRRKEGRQQEVADISRAMKKLAKDGNVTVVALAQLNRALESRTSKVPTLADLRESGSLEQDADAVLFLYREEVYDPESEKKGVAELHIAKHRNGPIGTVYLRFDPQTTRFCDLSCRTLEMPQRRASDPVAVQAEGIAGRLRGATTGIKGDCVIDEDGWLSRSETDTDVTPLSGTPITDEE